MPVSTWLTEFHAGSMMHGLMLLGVAIVTSAVIRAGYTARRLGTGAAIRFDRQFAVVLLALWIVLESRGVMPGHWRWDKSLPLHICDITGFVAPIALWTRRRIARAILYFWGIGLSTQAFITPMLFLGPSHLDFWTYTICHAVIVAAAAYDLAVRGYTPTWRDWQVMAVISMTYVLLVLPVNIRLGVNYGYVGKTDFAQATLVQALGSWPARVPRLVSLVWAGMALMVPLGNIRRTATDAPCVEIYANSKFTKPITNSSLPASRAA